VLARLSESIRQTLSETREVERIGPFLASFNPSDRMRFRNYAVPDDGARPTPTEVDALVAAFERRDRLPRLEYFTALCPQLTAILQRGGFRPEMKLPLMTLTRQQLVEPEAAVKVEVRAPLDAEEFLSAARVQRLTFGEKEPTTPAEGVVLKESTRLGGIVAVAVDPVDRRIVGVGQCTQEADGASEIVGVAVEEAARGRGIASLITHELARRAFAEGRDLVFLSPADGGAERTYLRCGFVRAGEQMHISIPTP
jgi:ribosomal protein S18 acetylase RimI-like enzyme